ncbi:hypothetical protein MASR2M29_04360 [Spirochaetota bacterium]
MKNLRLKNCRGLYAFIFVLAIASQAAAETGSAEAQPLLIEELMTAALEHDGAIADAQSRLKIAQNSKASANPLYKSSLSLSGTASDSANANSTTQTAQKTSVGASLSVPLAHWLALAFDATGSPEKRSGSAAISISPFAKADSSAESALQKAMIESQAAVRSSLLSVRKEYRAYQSAIAEYEYRRAAVVTAENELLRIQYLAELGKERKSKEISAHSELLDAQDDLDAAINSMRAAIQNLADRTGLGEDQLALIPGELALSDRDSVSAETWMNSSGELAIAKIALQQQKRSSSSSITLPTVTLGASISDTSNWSLTAQVSISPDLLFQKTSGSAQENLAIQERAFLKTEENVSSAYKNQQSALAMAERNYQNAQRFMDSARLSYEETSLLFGSGEVSQSTMDTAEEELLEAKWKLAKSVEALENAKDQLDPAWQLPI